MNGTPHALRFTRALALGAFAAASLAGCTRSATTDDRPPTGDRSAGADAVPRSVATDPAPTNPTVATSTPSADAPATNRFCSVANELRNVVTDTQVSFCMCRQSQPANEPPRRLWSCEDMTRQRTELDGQSCAQRDERRTVQRGAETDTVCRCMDGANGGLAWVCLLQHNVMVGPCAPPDMPA